MIRRFVVTGMAVIACGCSIALGDAKDDLTAAVKKTAACASYSWTSTVEGELGAGTSMGKFEKDGYMRLIWPVRDQTFEVVMKGREEVIKTEGGWKMPDEIGGVPGGDPRRMMAALALNYQAPLTEAEEALAKADVVKAEADGFSGSLNEWTAKQMLILRRHRNAEVLWPEMKNVKAEFRTWTKDGLVTKLQYHVTGTIVMSRQDRDVNRTTTIEIKDVGKTKVEVPEEARRKLEEDATRPR